MPRSGRRGRRAVSVAALAIAGTALAVGPASASPFTLQTNCYPSMGIENGSRITYPCYSQVQGGVAPYSFSWGLSKGAVVSPPNGQSVSVTCTVGQQIHLYELAYDANGQTREYLPGWQLCPYT